jgi:hypothetical protein
VVTERNGSWGTVQLAGTGVLNAGGEAEVLSVSCASAANCTAGGYYADRSGKRQAFVVNERNGSWGRAREVPGLGRLNGGGDAEVISVSCSSAGNCTAGGSYRPRTRLRPTPLQAFVVSERNGSWGRARTVPGLRLFAGSLTAVSSVSCTSAGNCTAGGSYTPRSSPNRVLTQAFVVDKRNGVWGRARVIPGSAKLNVGGVAGVASVSCASTGNCSAGGTYADNSGYSFQAFVVTERHGRWGQALEVPGSAKLSMGGAATLTSVSCATPGNCEAGGYYYTFPISNSSPQQAFVVSQRNGRWGRAQELPGSGKLNVGQAAGVNSVSCPAAGACSAGGFYGAPYNTSGYSPPQALVSSEQNGTWNQTLEVPGLATLSAGGEAQVLSLSCASAGNCAAGGYYYSGDTLTSRHAFVVDERNGTWGQAEEVPGSDH